MGTRWRLRQPVLIAEVLSPSSIADDFVDKLGDYQAIPSLAHYLILSQDGAARLALVACRRRKLDRRREIARPDRCR